MDKILRKNIHIFKMYDKLHACSCMYMYLMCYCTYVLYCCVSLCTVPIVAYRQKNIFCTCEYMILDICIQFVRSCNIYVYRDMLADIYLYVFGNCLMYNRITCVCDFFIMNMIIHRSCICAHMQICICIHVCVHVYIYISIYIYIYCTGKWGNI